MKRFTLSRFSRIKALPSTETSSLVPGARRFGLTRFSAPGTLQSRAVTVTGRQGTIANGTISIHAKQVTLSRFSSLGVLFVLSRPPLVAADRMAAIAGLGGYLAGRSYVVPDVSGGVNITFEEI